jgi:hypothetical protein
MAMVSARACAGFPVGDNPALKLLANPRAPRPFCRRSNALAPGDLRPYPPGQKITDHSPAPKRAWVERRKKYWPSRMPAKRTLAADKAGLAGKKPTAKVHSAPLAICIKP